MSVFRIHKNSNFTVMSNHHFKEKNMSLKAKGLLSLMLSLPDDWNYSVSGLVTLSKDGKDSVMSALAELEEFGYLARTRKTNSKGQFSGIEYHIYESPQKENPIAENQHSENQQEGKQNAENPPQLNTNKIKELNNKELNKQNKDIKENDLSVFQDILEEIEDKELKQLYIDYIDMRNTINSPVSKRALSMLIDRCARMANFDIALQKEMIEAAVINNWKSVFLPKAEEEKITKKEPGVYNREQRVSSTGYDALKNFNLKS